MKDQGKGAHLHSCKALVELLCDYLEGDLAPGEKKEIDRHMSDCPPCLAFLKTYRKTAEICKSLRPEEIPKELQERLIRYLETRSDRTE